jgi:uncharacterized membrane protein
MFRVLASYNLHKKLSQFDFFSTYPSFMHHSENLENIFHYYFVIDDGLYLNLALCCEINAHMNDIIFQKNIILI